MPDTSTRDRLDFLFDEKYGSEFRKFERVEDPLHRRRDLAAFLLIDRLVPSDTATTIISAAEHDQIWIEVDPEELSKQASDEDILTLIRCGIIYSSSEDSFYMFV